MPHHKDALTLRFLGEISVERGGQALSLPQSKKTRALLAYLAVTGRPQRRDRLCSLFWDVTDDPRGALRWSLSRIRPIVDGPRRQRLVADRDHVAFDSDGVSIDVFEARRQWSALGAQTSVKAIENVLQFFRGDFLEGLELPDFDEFQAWCIAEREQNRLQRAQILARMLDLVGSDSRSALPYAQTLVQVDPLNEAAHASLLRLLFAAGRAKEARRHYESGLRLLQESGSSGTMLKEAWQAQKPAAAQATTAAAPRGVEDEPSATLTPIVGRARELATLLQHLDETRRARKQSVVLLGGEPGIGKTRLLVEILTAAKNAGATVLHGSAFEAEATRPYGPWIDALRRVPAVTVGSTLGADLASLVPAFSPGVLATQTRDQLFGSVVELIAARAHTTGLVVLALDDVQWCDDASAELLHYVVRSSRHRPLLVLMAARLGELPDNTSVVRLMRSFRRDGVLQQILLEPLTIDEARQLAGHIHPSLRELPALPDTAGNPLFVLELARSSVERESVTVPATLVDLVRDRVERLQPPAPDVLRWGAVLGSTFTTTWISELSGIDLETMVRALESLERHGLIRATAADPGAAAYAFAHDIVRTVVYSTISEPRRRILHGRVAGFVSRYQDQNESLTPDVVQHAALAGDAAMAATACVAAGKRCLRLFANLQAESFAKRGMRFADQLSDPAGVRLLIELSRVAIGARRPAELEAEAERLEQLAERALDNAAMAHARLAFHLSSYLRWEGGDGSVAERDTLKAELISRTSDERERVEALAEAARCLAMLERDIGKASSLLVEASQVAEKIGAEAIAIPIAEGLLHLHEGRHAHAVRSLLHALELARRDRDRENEFSALEHLVMCRIDQEEYDEAQALTIPLVEIGEKLREGSEAPFARVLRKLSAYAQDQATAEELDRAIEDLQTSDAKQRLVFALSRAAQSDFKGGRLDMAERRAGEALRMAEILRRPSESALARSLLGRIMLARGEWQDGQACMETLNRLDAKTLSSRARASLQAFMMDFQNRKEAKPNGNSSRGTKLRATR